MSPNQNQQAICLTELFEVQVKQTPDDIAVVFGEQELTFQELNLKVNQLAQYPQSLGGKPEVFVGICLERSLEMVIGLLAMTKVRQRLPPIESAILIVNRLPNARSFARGVLTMPKPVRLWNMRLSPV